ncbi:hypothetical protein GCM10020331_069230 [Ectobacillus funiculus]
MSIAFICKTKHLAERQSTSVVNRFLLKTLEACLASDAVLLGAIGGPKWDNATERPEKKAFSLYVRHLDYMQMSVL